MKKLARPPKDKQIFCPIHHINAIQLGCCLTCENKSPICQTKGCIGFHQQNERAHNVITLEQIRHIVSQYIHSNNEKRAYLKKMVHEYFTIARKEVERLFTQVYDSLDRFVFDDLIFHEDDKILIDKLKNEEYENMKCEEIAVIVPKLIKSTNFEDGHFIHLRNYLIAEKEKVQTVLNSVLLNLPEFRWMKPEDIAYTFFDIQQQTLKDVNSQLLNMTNRPKKLRIKYGSFSLIQLMYHSIHLGYRISNDKQGYQGQKIEFVRLLGSLENLKDMEAFQLYCVWDIDENEFQLALFEAVLTHKYLKQISVYTSHKVTSTDFLEELAQSRSDVEIKVFIKDWTW